MDNPGLFICPSLPPRRFYCQPTRGQPASRLWSWIATFRRIVSTGLTDRAREEVPAWLAVGRGRDSPLSGPARKRPINGESTTEAATQPPSRIASDIAQFP